MGGGGSPSPAGYIQDGLVFRLDGIDKGATDGTWVDLVDGVVFTNYSATSLDDGWAFDGSTTYLTSSASNNFLGQNEDFTVEVCIVPARIVGKEPVFVFSQSVNNGVLFFISGSAVTFLQKRNTYPITRVAGSPLCVSLNLTLGMINGVNKSKNSGTDFWENNAPYIGRRVGGNGGYFQGKIHAIRIYNKRLTEAEMLNNQRLDNTRFNLGLTI